MLVHQTFQYRAYTSKAGYAAFDEALRHLCNLYNAALAERILRYKLDKWPAYQHHYGIGKPDEKYSGYAWLKCWNCGVAGEYHVLRAVCEDCAVRKGKGIYFAEQSRELTQAQLDNPELHKLSRKVKVGVLYRLDLAFKRFFQRVEKGETPGFPRFKSLSQFKTMSPRGIEIYSRIRKQYWLKKSPDGKKAFLTVSGLPRLKIRTGKRGIPEGKLTRVTLTRKDWGITASMTFEVEKEELSKTDQAVGIDVGVAKLIATSDGETIQPFPADDPKDESLQRQMSKRHRKGKKKQSNRYRELQQQLRRHRANKRLRKRNRLHQLTTDLVRRYDLIAIEKLQLEQMTKSAKGTEKNPGTNVQQKAGLNRSILAQSWGLCAYQLKYKAEWAGKTVVSVPPHYTSQTCANCGTVSAENRKKENYKCACGYQADADVNAAINILCRALSTAGQNLGPGRPQDYRRPGGEVCAYPSSLQEPTTQAGGS